MTPRLLVSIINYRTGDLTIAAVRSVLDALGDLALAGSPILGRYVGHKAGHARSNTLLRELFARPDAYRIVACGHDMAGGLPGVGVSKLDLALCA